MYNTSPEPVLDSDYAHNTYSRPIKRRKVSDGRYSPSLQQVALEEIDLEIAIRQRLAEVVQSRLTWALLLQESLQKSIGLGPNDLHRASLDALDAIEAPCNLIFNRESRIVPVPRILTNPHPPPALSISDSTQSLRTSSRAARIRPPAAPSRLLLFLRNAATTPHEIAKLACTVCSRSDFSNLQGLLNHCRLRHGIEYGSHDECVQSCAVLVPEDQRDWVVTNGIELGGISLPSLKRLFEIAVGAGSNVALPALSSKPLVTAPSAAVKTEGRDVVDATPPAATESREDSSRTPPVQTTAHVTRTLGYHADTPALAAFLGRAPKKRCINVRANEDEPVDIEDTSAGSGLQRRRMWRKPWIHRNIARKELDEVVPLSDLPINASKETKNDRPGEAHPQGESSEETFPGLQMLSGTRFHIAARVQVADYSLYIPPNRRPADHTDHTHRWRLAVTSPSYSLPISSVLSKLTIMSLSDPPPQTLATPVTITKSPFVFTSTAVQPFLAQLTFVWAGTTNPPTEIEHWVELDPMRYQSAVLGEEQVFDVELDRQTELLPVSEDAKGVSWEDVQMAEADAGPEKFQSPEQEEGESEPEYSTKLKSLLPQFPMTMKDTKGRLPAKLPYTLVSTPAQFRNLHYGRRKAIEMGRARALREAYTDLLTQSSKTVADVVPLTTTNVFHWLEDEGLFPRSDMKKAAAASQPQKHTKSQQMAVSESGSYVETFCRTCGLERAYHPSFPDQPSLKHTNLNSVTTHASERALRTRTSLCMSFREEEDEGEIATRPPVVDVVKLLDKARLISTVVGAHHDREPFLLQRQADSSLPYGLCPAIFASHPRTVFQNNIFASDLQFPPPAADLVAVADPQLVVAIQLMTGFPYLRSARIYPSLKTYKLDDAGKVSHDRSCQSRQEVSSYPPSPSLSLSSPGPSLSQSLAPLPCTLRNVPRADIEARLAPSAALALAVRALVGRLVRRGVDELHCDEATLRSVAGRHRRRHGAGSVRRVLTPVHVLSGVQRHAQTDIADSALWLCLAQLGVRSSKSVTFSGTGSKLPPNITDTVTDVAMGSGGDGVHFDHLDGGAHAGSRPAGDGAQRDRPNGDVVEEGTKDCAMDAVTSGSVVWSREPVMEVPVRAMEMEFEEDEDEG